ncbi:MAG: hypothetical protein RI554_06330 [Trueperaceae bacterium]|nr:hypothetical protein [Trueperaceae bacterium]
MEVDEMVLSTIRPRSIVPSLSVPATPPTDAPPLASTDTKKSEIIGRRDASLGSAKSADTRPPVRPLVVAEAP